MAQRYPPGIDAAIWAAVSDGLGTTEIRRRLARGTLRADLSPVDIPRRTLRDRIARLKQVHGDPDPSVAPGAEADAAAGISRRLISLADAQVRRLERLARDRPLTSTELTQGERAARVILAAAKVAEPSDKPQPAPTSDLLAELASETDQDAGPGP